MCSRPLTVSYTHRGGHCGVKPTKLRPVRRGAQRVPAVKSRGRLQAQAVRPYGQRTGCSHRDVYKRQLKHRVGLNGNMHDHIAGRAAVGTGIALAAQCNVLVIINTSGDIDLQRCV